MTRIFFSQPIVSSLTGGVVSMRRLGVGQALTISAGPSVVLHPARFARIRAVAPVWMACHLLHLASRKSYNSHRRVA
jgi:hypothetical protein